MVTDYVMFIHGVHTRNNILNPSYADPLFANIQAQVTETASSLRLEKVALYWGDVANEKEDQLWISPWLIAATGGAKRWQH